MRIVNAMFGRKKGGIEQAFVDYSAALSGQGNVVLTLTHPDAAVIPLLQGRGIAPVTARNYGQWDVWAIYKLRKILAEFQPDMVITHGNRATSLLRRAADDTVPIVGVCHNYNLKHLLKCTALFTITNHLRETVIARGYPAANVFVIPNMIAIPELHSTDRLWQSPPVIGAMGRFVAKKGFDVFIQALKLLKVEGVQFRAVLGGGGEQEAHLRALAVAAGVADCLAFTGWVEDKEEFFQSCDIFCLPSLHEPFGIVLLEALLYGMPVVSTMSEGPREIVTDGQEALLVPIGEAMAMAVALKRLLSDREFALALADKGRETVCSRYSIEVVGERLQEANQVLLSAWRANG